MEDLDIIISALDVHKDQDFINQWIKEYTPFILTTLSTLKNEYIQIENDESYSVALLAVVEAIERYDIGQGHFLPFCRLVITSRVKNQLKNENRHHHLSLDEIDLETPVFQGDQYLDSDLDSALKEEIQILEDTLKTFGIQFQSLIESAPKHKDTKSIVVATASKVQKEADFMMFLWDKKKLPLRQIAERFFVSLKTLKTYKHFIIAIILILDKNLRNIKKWIKL